jgi:hypothetical protein
MLVHYVFICFGIVGCSSAVFYVFKAIFHPESWQTRVPPGASVLHKCTFWGIRAGTCLGFAFLFYGGLLPLFRWVPNYDGVTVALLAAGASSTALVAGIECLIDRLHRAKEAFAKGKSE